MPEPSHESKIAQLDKDKSILEIRLKHISKTFDEHAALTKEGFVMLDNKIGAMMDTQKDTTKALFMIESTITKLDGIEKRLVPVEETMRKINGVGFVVKNISYFIAIVGGIVAATVYYLK